MKVCIALEQRFSRTADGAMWTDGPCPSSFWPRYLEVFDEVRVVARVRDVEAAKSTWKRSDCERVEFAPVPNYVGPQQYLLKARAVRRAVRGAIGERDAVILRVPSQLAATAYPMLLRKGQPYAVEVVGDPYDSLAPGAVRHPLRPFFRRWFTHELRRHCRSAFAAAYVTAGALQRRYPPHPTAHAIGCSDVELPPSALVERHRADCTRKGQPYTLVMVGTLAQLYKAPDVLVDAVARCVRRGLDLRLVFVGDGQYRQELEDSAANQGLEGRVDFLGQLPSGEGVVQVLDQADVFVLPSRQEGLPRALVEAMARGLPCISSTVGGIPELLPADDMVPPGDVEALAQKIQEVVTDPARMVRMSQRNLKTAREYREDVLQQQRISFYEYVRSHTQECLDRPRGVAGRLTPASAAANATTNQEPAGAASL